MQIKEVERQALIGLIAQYIHEASKEGSELSQEFVVVSSDPAPTITMWDLLELVRDRR